MRRLIGLVVLLTMPISAMGLTASLDVVLSGGGSETTINLGDSVVLDVMLSTDTGLDGIQYEIAVNNYADQDKWKTGPNPNAWIPVTGLGTATGFDYFNYGAGIVSDYVAGLGNADGSLDDSDDKPDTLLSALGIFEGYAKQSGTSNVLATPTLLCSYTIVSMALGDYTISVSEAGTVENGPSKGDDAPGWAGGSNVLVHVVPEPATALLLLAAIPFLRRRR